MRRSSALFAAGFAALIVLVLMLRPCRTAPDTEPPFAGRPPDAARRVATAPLGPRPRAADASPSPAPGTATARPPAVPAPAAAPAGAAPAPPTDPADAKPPAAPLYAEVSGRVLLAAGGAPVPDGKVALRCVAAGANVPERGAVTDTRGEFRFAAVPPGRFLLVAAKEGFAPRTVYGVEVTQDRGRDGIEILLTTGGTIEGRVTDGRGAPAGGLHVRIERGNPNVPAGATTTGADGVYRFEHLPPEEYRVELDRGGGRTQTGFVAVTDDHVAHLDFGSEASVAGVLLDAAGKPLAGAMVTAWAAGPPTVSRKAQTGPDGRYALTGLAPGEWAIQVQVFGTEGFAASAGKLSVASGDNEFPIRLAAGEISGRVFARATGAALPPRALQITARPLDPAAGPFSSAMAFAREDGTFRFAALSAGRYRIWAYPHDPSLKAAEVDVDLAAGERREGVEIALEPCRTGKFRVVARDAAGKPVEGLTVAVIAADGTGTTGPTPTPEPGVYVLRLEVGSRTVELSRADLATSRVTAEVKEGETTTVETVLAAKEEK